LLQAEYDEEEKILMQRLEHWSMDKLKRDGFMLHDLGASILPKQPKNVEGLVWTFNKIGKEDNKDLPFHTFEYAPLLSNDPSLQSVPENMSFYRERTRVPTLFSRMGLFKSLPRFRLETRPRT
jgi:hypothetical protein